MNLNMLELIDLKAEVNYWLLDNDLQSKQEKIELLNSLMEHGCVSGMVIGLIYYEDTIAFYQKYKEEINRLLGDTLEESGESPEGVFGEKWNTQDPLVLYTQNQNLLAWFAFEETAYRLLNDLEESENEDL